MKNAIAQIRPGSVLYAQRKIVRILKECREAEVLPLYIQFGIKVTNKALKNLSHKKVIETRVRGTWIGVILKPNK